MAVMMNEWTSTKHHEVRYLLKARPNDGMVKARLYFRVNEFSYLNPVSHQVELYKYDLEKTDEEMQKFIDDYAVMLYRAMYYNLPGT